MTEQVRYRIETTLVKEMEDVCRNIGITPTQAVSMFFSHVTKLRGLPFRPSEYPALDEYGVTLEQVKAASDEVHREFAKADREGKLVEFTGKVP